MKQLQRSTTFGALLNLIDGCGANAAQRTLTSLAALSALTLLQCRNGGTTQQVAPPATQAATFLSATQAAPGLSPNTHPGEIHPGDPSQPDKAAGPVPQSKAAGIETPALHPTVRQEPSADALLHPLPSVWAQLSSGLQRQQLPSSGQMALSSAGVHLIDTAGYAQPFAFFDEQNSRTTPEPASVNPSSNQGYARGRAAVGAQNQLFWVKGQSLVRAPAPSHGSGISPAKPPEVLAPNAAPGSRVVVLAPPAQGPWVSYIAAADGQNGNKAKLWRPEVASAPPLNLSATGSSALSVDLSLVGDQVQVWMLEARLGTSAIHLRSFNAKTPQQLSEDRVVWVGGTTQSETELRVGQVEGNPALLIALERDASRFGLATLVFTDQNALAEPLVTWVDYKNGFAPAPVATGMLCGASAVIFSRPASSVPGAPIELVLAELTNRGTVPMLVLDTVPRLRDIVFHGAATAGFVGYTTDTQTRLVKLPCKRSKGN